MAKNSTISMATSLKYELCSFPASLFEELGVITLADKLELAKVIAAAACTAELRDPFQSPKEKDKTIIIIFIF